MITKKKSPELDSLLKSIKERTSTRMTQAQFAMDYLPKKRSDTIATVMNLSRFNDEDPHPVENLLEVSINAVMTRRFDNLRTGIFDHLEKTTALKYLNNKEFQNLKEETAAKIASKFAKDRSFKYLDVQDTYVQLLPILGKEASLEKIKSLLNSSLDIKQSSASDASSFPVLCNHQRNQMRDSLKSSIAIIIDKLAVLIQ